MKPRPVNPLGRSLRQDRRGIAAIEFALVVPVAFGLYLATVEITNLARAQTKFGAIASSMAELVAEQNPIGPGTKTADFCTGEGYTMAPFSADSLQIQVDSVTNVGGAITDAWTKSCGTVANAVSAVTLASSLVPNPGNSVIVVQAQYTYSAPITYLLPATATFTGTGYAWPRLGTPIAYPP